MEADFGSSLALARVHGRKKLENYLLVPNALERAAKKQVQERNRRTGSDFVLDEEFPELLRRISDEYCEDCRSNVIGERVKFFQGSTSTDPGTVARDATLDFQAKWNDLESRLRVVPGKQVLRRVREHLQEKYGISLTTRMLVNELLADEIPGDLRDTLHQIEDFRCS